MSSLLQDETDNLHKKYTEPLLYDGCHALVLNFSESIERYKYVKNDSFSSYHEEMVVFLLLDVSDLPEW